MITSAEADALAGAGVIDRDGARVGTVVKVFSSDDGDQPLFITLRPDSSGGSGSVVPLQSAELRNGTLQVAFDLDTITSAPDLESAGTISDDEQGTIFDYYDAIAGGAPSGAEGTPAGLTDTPEERTVTVERPGSESDGDGAEPLAGGSDAGEAAS